MIEKLKAEDEVAEYKRKSQKYVPYAYRGKDCIGEQVFGGLCCRCADPPDSRMFTEY